MSDPVTNVEIEDVLSSIRRLVAEGDRATAPEAGVPIGADEEPVEKFVLTPALRVTQHSDAKKPLVDLSVTEEAAPLVLEPQVDDTSAANEESSVQDDAVLLLKNHDVSASRESLEATIAELEAAVTAQPDEFEPDGSESKPEVNWENVGFLRAVPSVQAPDDIEQVEPDAVDDHSEGPELVVAHSDTLSQTAQAAAVLKAAQVSFRRGGGRDDLDTDYGDQLAETKTADAQLESYLEGGHAIDEATLRKLVVEVVREELQGELGERITRNVRKLVRREIHRVLTTEDFT